MPARFQHFCGLWERAVKSVKHQLPRIIGDQPISFEVLKTILIQIEEIRNS